MVPPILVIQRLLSFPLNPLTTHSPTQTQRMVHARFKVVVIKVLLPCVDQEHICEAESV